MLNNLLDLVKQHAGSAIIDNPAIPNERNDEAVSLASSSIFDTLKNAAGSGNISDIMNMFQGGNATSNPLANVMQNGFVQNLMSKFGLDQNAAGGVASSLIPNVLQNLVSKTNDPNDSSFNLQDIVSKVGGGIMDTIKGLFGK